MLLEWLKQRASNRSFFYNTLNTLHMKTITLLTSLLLLSITNSSLKAQETHNKDPKNNPITEALLHTFETDTSILDRLQKETEDISAMKPLLFIASVIDNRLELKRLEKESIAVAKSREPGSK